MSALDGAYPSQQFHCLAKPITIHLNISLCGADMMGIVYLLHALFNSFPLETDFFFLQFSNRIRNEQPKEIR
jgi:hypothetical protein